MKKNIWDDFYKEVIKINKVEKIKNWCNKSNVQFEPYARATTAASEWKENELMCSCCFSGDIDPDKEYLLIKIGDNTGFEKNNFDEVYGYEIDKDLDDLIYEYEKELKTAMISHNISNEKLIDFCKELNIMVPQKGKCIDLSWKVKKEKTR